MPRQRGTDPAPPESQYREALEAAHAEAAKVGPQDRILAADILPPLPHTPDMLFAQAVLMPAGVGGGSGRSKWADMPLAQVDPRAPWKLDGVLGLVQRVGYGSFVIIEPYWGSGDRRSGGGWKAILVVAHDGGVSTHTLVHATSQRPVRFDDRYSAEAGLQPTVNAEGVPPAKWTWAPPADAHGAVWTALPAEKSKPGVDAISWRGNKGQWIVVEWTGAIFVVRKRSLILDPSGHPRCFADIAAAKWFCEGADR